MRKIIDRKLYDTDTAKLIYTEFKVMKRRDYYRTHKGAFFCHFVSVGDIQLVSEEEMMDILASKDVEKYIEIFGDVAEG